MRIKFLNGLIILIALTACTGPSSRYIVKRKVSDNPSFVVYPSYESSTEIAYANEIEKKLISFRLKVLLPPSLVYTEISEEDVKFAAESQGKLIGGGIDVSIENITEKELNRFKKESFFSLASTKADYIIHTFVSDSIAKIYKTSTRELLGYLIYNIKETENKLLLRSKIRKFLKSLGVLLPIDKSVALSNNQFKKEIYTIRNDVPIKPAFAIIPFGSRRKDLRYARYIESLIFDYGVKIVLKPFLKKVQKSNVGFGKKTLNIIKSPKSLTASKGAGKKIKKYFYEYEKSDADYYVATYANSNQIRIIKKSDKSVVSVFTIRTSKITNLDDKNAKIIKSEFQKLGIHGSKIMFSPKSLNAPTKEKGIKKQ